ncbi:MAG: C25 family cysteine peptidase [Acidobacteriota bacterium]
MNKSLPLSTRRIVTFCMVIAVVAFGTSTAHMQKAGAPQLAKPNLPAVMDVEMISVEGAERAANESPAATETVGAKPQTVGAKPRTIQPKAFGTCDTAGPIEVEASGGVVGPTAYATLGAAFTAINAGTHTGTITIDVAGDTVEAAAATLNASGSGSASYTSITISPCGGAARTISGSVSAEGMILLNGADNVTIDGLNTGGNSLTISNINSGAVSATSTIRFIGGATNNLVTRSSILGSFSGSVATNGGNIFFSTDGVTANGNDNNTISFCNIGPAGANLPTKLVYGNGSITTPAIRNSGVLIDNNNLFDFFSATTSVSGVHILSGNDNWTVSNNKIYQTATRTFTGAAGIRYSAITLNSTTAGNQGAFTVTGNTIGFGAANGTGTTTITGTGTGLGNEFKGIDAPSVNATTVTSIQGNTISGINVTSNRASATTSTSAFMGMLLGTTTGRFDIGNITGNTIGSLDGSTTIVVSQASTTANNAPVTGIYDNSFVSANNINNNNIGSITINSGGTGTTTGFRGILLAQTTGISEKTVNNNTIGGAVAAGAITDNIVGSYAMYAIQNANANLTATGNTIRNMIGNANGAVVVMSGILVTGSTGVNTISQNTVHSLSNTVTGGSAGAIYAIDCSLATAANVVERNLVHSISVTSTLTAYQIFGLVMRGTGTATFKNNMVRLGLDAAGSSITTGFSIVGIRDIVGATSNYYHNSVYVGGSGVVSVSNTYCFLSDVVTNTRNYQDNIFWNARSNTSGGIANIAIRVGGTAPNPAGLTSDFNDLYFTGTDGATGVFNGLVVPTLADWRTATGQDNNSLAADPQFMAPNAAAATVNLHVQPPSPVLSAGLSIGSVTNDFDNDPRPASNPDIGADEVVMAAGGVIAAGTYFNASANDGDSLGGDVTITNMLTLNGKLSTGAFTLTIGCNATVVGAGAGNYVIGNLKKTFCSIGAFNFVVGTANGFSPVAVNVTAGTFPADFTVKAVQGPQPNIGSPTHALQRYWVLTATGVTADLTFNYLDPPDVPVTAVEANFVILKYDGTFTAPGGSVNTVANTAAITGVTSFSDWTLAEPNAPTAIELASLKATEYDTGTYLQWQTGAEVRNLGFNIYRDEGGKRTQVNPQLIAGGALLAGSDTVLKSGKSYSWWISSASGKSASQLWLEDVDLSGQSTWHGPIGAKQVGGKPPTTSDAAVLSQVGVAESQAGSSAQVTRSAALTRVAASQIKLQTDLAGKQAVKVSVRREAWYRVTQADLLAAGFNAKVDPQMLQMHVDGRQIPISVITNQKQISAVDFYGRGIDASYTDARVYWLVAGTQPGLRVPQVKGEGYPTSSRSFFYTVERKDRTIYFSSLRNGEKENFFGAVIASSPVDQTLNLQHVVQGATGQAQLEVSLQGVTQLPHRVWAYLNGTFVGELMFNGQAQGVAKLPVSQTLLREGDNQVRFEAQGGTGDVSLVDCVRLGYFHGFTADNNALRFTATGGQAVTIGGFGSGAIRVLDVTDPDSVREVVGKVQQMDDGYSITVASPQPGERVLLAGIDDERSRPARVTDNKASNLRSAEHAANLVIIANRETSSSVEPLRAKRASQGFKVEVVDVEDIFDEFSFGNKSPQAVRDFLLYAQTGWKVAPQYVLLVGDASLDPKGYLGYVDSDLVPTMLIDTALLETAWDDGLADFNWDGIPELAVGRLPVRTGEEAARMIEKIVAYDQSNPSGSVMLVADGNEGFDFETASLNLVSLVPGSLKVDVLNRGQLDPAIARSQLMDGINRGQKVVNYLGHGSVNVWRGGLLTNEDAAGMVNGRLPLFVMMTCLNGYFQDPGVDSLAEALMKSRGGAIAVWASSGMTGPDGQAAMDRQVFELIFRSSNIKGQAPTLGEAMLRAKRGVGDIDVRRTYTLFGDPTTRLR